MSMKSELAKMELSCSGCADLFIKNGIFVYSIPNTDLAHGTSLGNGHAWATSKGTGAIQSLFSTDVGKEVTGSLVINYFAPYKDLLQYTQTDESDHEVGADTIVRLARAGTGTFELHPAYQSHSFDLIGGIHIVETFFLPNTGFDDEAAVIQMVEIENQTDHEQTIAAIGCVAFAGQTEHDIVAKYDSGLGSIIAWNEGNPNLVRAFGAVPHPDAYLASNDIEEGWNPRYPLANTTDERGTLAGSLQKTLFLRKHERKCIAFIVAFTQHGKDRIKQAYHSVTDYQSLLDRTIARYETVIRNSDIMTPDTIINQGAQWCKANMLRVLSNYPTGIAFTNNPGFSTNVVGRDAAWFAAGCDYMLPDASCELLQQFANRQEDCGLIIEYYNALTNEVDDYGLNINDNTPLFIIASARHIEVTGHKTCKTSLYPSMLKAADYILAQIDDRGLVFCSANGIAERGIAGWRNIIENRAINGAVTEINSECYAALRAVARIARMQNDTENERKYDDAAAKLRDSINAHLKNPNNGMYYLNIDIHGNKITEVTADQLFPMIFGVSDAETSQKITLRLTSPDFMTAAGLRTESSLNPLYRPDTLVGLQGGVWPGVTWWYAMASVQSDPALLIESLKRSYMQYIKNPATYNTVPGQFSEWFDGESFVNRGMRLSPWEPPRYLWALIEGAIGLDVTEKHVKIQPKIPLEWKWLRMRNLKTSAGNLNFFASRHRGNLIFYSSSSFLEVTPAEIYDTELTDLLDTVSDDSVVAAYGRKNEIIVCIGSIADSKIPVPFIASRLLDNARRYNVKLYQSEIGEWLELGHFVGGSMSRLSIEIEPFGYVIFKFGE